MLNDLINKIIDYSFQLISEASLSIGASKGTGLGAVLLAMILISIVFFG
jgi:hypothetical protein